MLNNIITPSSLLQSLDFVFAVRMLLSAYGSINGRAQHHTIVSQYQCMMTAGFVIAHRATSKSIGMHTHKCQLRSAHSHSALHGKQRWLAWLPRPGAWEANGVCLRPRPGTCEARGVCLWPSDVHTHTHAQDRWPRPLRNLSDPLRTPCGPKWT